MHTQVKEWNYLGMDPIWVRTNLADHVKGWKKMNIYRILSETFLRIRKFLQNISFYFEWVILTGEKLPGIQRPTNKLIRVFPVQS